MIWQSFGEVFGQILLPQNLRTRMIPRYLEVSRVLGQLQTQPPAPSGKKRRPARNRATR